MCRTSKLYGEPKNQHFSVLTINQKFSPLNARITLRLFRINKATVDAIRYIGSLYRATNPTVLCGSQSTVPPNTYFEIAEYADDKLFSQVLHTSRYVLTSTVFTYVLRIIDIILYLLTLYCISPISIFNHNFYRIHELQ